MEHTEKFPMRPLGTLVLEVKQACPTLFMSFSGGADAIAMFLRLLETDSFDMKGGKYYYYYMFKPSWVEEYLCYFEDKFNIQIARVPSHIFYEMFCNGFYQTPFRLKALDKLNDDLSLEDCHFYLHKKDDIEYLIKTMFGLPDECYTAIGIKQGDSPRRRKTLRTNQGINHNNRKWYPIFDFENRDVVHMIKRHNIKLPYCYKLFGISFENIDYRFSKKIKEQCPNNWERLKEWYPQIETIILRHEHYVPYRKAKEGVFIKYFQDNILNPIQPL